MPTVRTVEVRIHPTVDDDGTTRAPLPWYDKKTTNPDGTWTVLVPEWLCDEQGNLDEARLRQAYRGNATWDREGVLDGVQAV